MSTGSKEGERHRTDCGRERRVREGMHWYAGSVGELEMPSGGGSEDGTVRNFETSRGKGSRFVQVRDGG